MKNETSITTEIGNNANLLLATVPDYILHQEHDEEIKRVMDATGCTFRKWNGKAFWELANECGHTSLDFNKCDCKRHCC
jgi:hypothetical protein